MATHTFLLYGLFGNENTWRYVVPELSGIGNVHATDYGSSLAPIAVQAQLFRESVEDIVGAEQECQINLVGYSLGGIVARQFLYEECPSNVRVCKLITLGAPLMGMGAARIFSILCRAQSALGMIPGSELLQAHRTNALADTRTQYHHIAAANDWMVSQDSALGGTQAAKKHVIGGIGHNALPFSCDVVGVIREILKPKQE